MVTSLFLALSFLSYTSSNLPSSVSHRSTYIRSLSNFPEAFSLLNHLNSFAYPPPLPISYFFILPRFTPNLMKCNHLSPTALCLCSCTKQQSQSWGPQQSTPYCFLFPAVRQLFPPFSMKPPDPLLLLPFRPCVLLHWKKKERRKKESAKNFIGCLPHLLPSILCSFVLQGIKTKSSWIPFLPWDTASWACCSSASLISQNISCFPLYSVISTACHLP